MIWLHSQLRSGLFMWRNWKWGIIILAVAWAIAGGVLGREWAVLHGVAKVTENYQRCLGAPNQGPKTCQKTFRKQSAKNERRPHWAAAATVGLFPIAIVWLLVWGAMALVRLIRRGFQPAP